MEAQQSFPTLLPMPIALPLTPLDGSPEGYSRHDHPLQIESKLKEKQVIERKAKCS